ncbi:YncE family protein [Candidatus Methanoperedens nitratireducens]|uniref:40-residue YVTN family beta-propeller repeat protein n=1 Tax=Candidatus Methanoperedens nitratireducens TaxID=1392998 RepID=A0A284VPT2_9EURY|nr:YncE family protein [Candidatus Methanoperedens nitroreducens]SNQ61291.1 hypothetical protein MNV_30024 [Candidatus Methanoperedens nitroreducens]
MVTGQRKYKDNKVESKIAVGGKRKQRIKLSIVIPIIALAILSALIFINGRGTSSGEIAVEFTAQLLEGDNSSTQGENTLVARKEALLTFRLKDNKTGQLVYGLSPEIGFYPDENVEISLAKVQLFVLNSERGTIEVLDTFGGYDPRPASVKGMGTMTSKVIRLKGSPNQKVTDMVAGRYGDYLYITLPGENQVAIVNTMTHEVLKYIDAGSMPSRMFLQPRSKFLWVSNEGFGGGVGIIDTVNNTLAKTIETGKGYHQVAFSPEFAYVTNSYYNTVSVIRLSDLAKLEDIKVRETPYGIDYSNASGEVYVTNVLSGTVTVIDASTRSIKKHIPLSMGIELIKFSPDGRRGVVLDKHANTAYIIDAATSSIIKTVKTGEAPGAVGFIEEYALVRNTYSNDVTYISMDNPDVSNNELVGGAPPLNVTLRSLQTTPYGDEVVITSPEDTRIYFMHKMNGEPMVMNSATVEYGSNAVAIVENKLHETSPGTYQQYIILDREGSYDVEFRSGKINATFKIEVLPDRTTGFQTAALFNKTFITGGTSTLQYRITSRKTGLSEENLTDLIFVVIKPGKGAWTKRLPSRHIGNGTYEAKIAFPEEGEYIVTLASGTLSSRGYETAYDYVKVKNATT